MTGKNYLNFRNCQIGSGNWIANNYLNIDLLDFMFDEEVNPGTCIKVLNAGDNAYFLKHDIATGIPIKNNQLEVVYHSHILEHFNDEDGFRLLHECFRILKSGGVMRILVPDLELWSKNYIE